MTLLCNNNNNNNMFIVCIANWCFTYNTKRQIVVSHLFQWNDMIKTFKENVPVGRHRRQFKTYERCFVASSAVTWFHKLLNTTERFGLNVTR